MEGRYALIIRDIYTGIIMAYPTARRDTDSVVRRYQALLREEENQAGIFG